MANLNFLMVKTTFLAAKIPNDGSTCSTSPVLPGPRRWPCALRAFRARGAAHGAHGAHHGAHHAVTWTWEKGGKHINFGRLTSLNWVRLGKTDHFEGSWGYDGICELGFSVNGGF